MKERRPAAYNNNTIMAASSRRWRTILTMEGASSWFDRVAINGYCCIHVQQQQKCGGSLYIVTWFRLRLMDIVEGEDSVGWSPPSGAIRWLQLTLSLLEWTPRQSSRRSEWRTVFGKPTGGDAVKAIAAIQKPIYTRSNVSRVPAVCGL